jgi:hypothetical protein
MEAREQGGEERSRRSEDPLSRVVDDARALGEIAGVSKRDVGIVDEERSAPQRGDAENERETGRQPELARAELRRRRRGRRRVNARR